MPTGVSSGVSKGAVYCCAVQVNRRDRNSATDRALVAQKLLSGLRWAARRMGPSTGSLEVKVWPDYGMPSCGEESALIHAFSAAQLKQLRCLESLISTRSNDCAALAVFPDWLLQQTPNFKSTSPVADQAYISVASHSTV